MPKPRVYVETTIPNFYYDLRESEAVTSRREITRTWWTGAASRFDLVTSTIVTRELARGRSPLVPLRLNLLKEIPRVPVVSPVAEIVQAYIAHRLMPAKPPEDALHLALASWHDCDFIVTWNCRHLANPNKAAHIHKINTLLGLGVPKLVTPGDLLEGE